MKVLLSILERSPLRVCGGRKEFLDMTGSNCLNSTIFNVGLASICCSFFSCAVVNDFNGGKPIAVVVCSCIGDQLTTASCASVSDLCKERHLLFLNRDKENMAGPLALSWLRFRTWPLRLLPTTHDISPTPVSFGIGWFSVQSVF